MKITYGLAPESFKLVWGDRARFNPKTIEEMPKEISLISAGNSTAAFQLLITADSEYALNVTENNWFSQSAKRRSIRLSAEMPFECELKHIGMHLCDDAYYRADSLQSKSVVEAKEDELLSVYCEIKVPKSTEKGIYNGKINIYEGYGFETEKLVGSADITLEVFAFDMPENEVNGFHLDLWQHPSNIARRHGVELWSDRHFDILASYCESLGELGNKCVTVIASEIPWNGQGCQNEQRFEANLFEYSMIPVIRKPDGALEFDFSIMQRYIDLCAMYGIEECIQVFGLINVWDTKEYGGERTAPDYPDGIHIRVYNEADGSYGYLHTAKEIDSYIKALESYFIETDQIDRVRVAADEPADVEAYRESLNHVMEIAPAFKYKTAINHAEFVNEFGNVIYDFAPYISAMYSEYDALMRFKAEMPDKRFLYYVCCAPEVPNSFLRSELVDGYYIGILAAYAKMDGFLRWSYTCWTDHPNSDYRYGPFPAGDLGYVYPSADGRPLLSLRYKTLRKGICLFALIKEAEKRKLDNAIEEFYSLVLREREISKLYANWEREKIMSLSADDYRNAEKILLTALEVNK